MTRFSKEIEIARMLRQHKDFHPNAFVSDDTYRCFADELAKRLTTSAIEKGLSDISRTAGKKYPELFEIKNAARKHMVSEQSKVKAKTEEVFVKKRSIETKNFEQQLEKFKTELTEKELKDYLLFWIKHVFGQEALDNFKNYGLTGNLFLRSAITDLTEAEGDPKLAVQIGKKKQQKGNQ